MSAESRQRQQQLDSTQYAPAVIDHYELVFGRDFVSPGGSPMAMALLRELNLPAGSRVLDVGCGLGGSAFLMARQFKLQVDGIDLSKNMITVARQRCSDYGLAGLVTLVHGDCLELEHIDQYDAAYSRDVFLHIDDKSRLFNVLFKALKPGGTLLFTDYCCGSGPWQPEFKHYVEQRGYSLLTVAEYAEVLVQAGFVNVEANNMTKKFVEILETELSVIDNLQIADSDKRELHDSWTGKLQRAEAGDHQWGLIRAVKPGQ